MSYQPRVAVIDLGGGRLALSVAVLPVARPQPGHPVPVRQLARLRNREHRAGRSALRAGLSALGVPAGRLARRPDGAVQAPPRVLVTISHRDGCAVAAAWAPTGTAAAGGPGCSEPGRPTARLTGLGVDIELAGFLPARAMHLVCTDEELDGVRAEPSWLDPTRLFAAKEALYKATPLGAERPFRPRELPLRPLNAHTGLYVLARRVSTTTAYVTTRQVGNRWIALCVGREQEIRS
jgi:4'-phosphopantetheinyl transferase EntD